MKRGTPEEAELIKNAIKHGGIEQLEAITAAVQNSGALDYTLKAAHNQSDMAKEALSGVPDSKYKVALIALADLAVNRDH